MYYYISEEIVVSYARDFNKLIFEFLKNVSLKHRG